MTTRRGFARQTLFRVMVSVMFIMGIAVFFGGAYFAGSTKVGAKPEDRDTSAR